MPEVNRRAFLVSAAAVGGALTLGFADPAATHPDRNIEAPEITAWIVIGPDDRVTIRVARSEMGQGVFTALPMFALGPNTDRNRDLVGDRATNRHCHRPRRRTIQ